MHSRWSIRPRARRPSRFRWPRWLPLGLLLALLILTRGQAWADATPVRVVLTYLDGVSNWGPREASGAMELVRQEGEVRLSARGLPAEPGKHYVLWLSHEGTNEVFRLGEMQLRSDGTGVIDVVLPDAVPDKGWNLALLTLEDEPTPAHPGPHHAIAGRFPQFEPDGPLPRTLPNTGGGGGSASGAAILLIGLGALAIASVGPVLATWRGWAPKARTGSDPSMIGAVIAADRREAR